MDRARQAFFIFDELIVDFGFAGRLHECDGLALHGFGIGFGSSSAFILSSCDMRVD